jgi:hypothetical protein
MYSVLAAATQLGSRSDGEYALRIGAVADQEHACRIQPPARSRHLRKRLADHAPLTIDSPNQPAQAQPGGRVLAQVPERPAPARCDVLYHRWSDRRTG